MFIDEFPKQKRTRMRNTYSDEDLSGSPDDYSFYGFRHSPDENIPNLLKRVKFLSSCGKQNIKLRLKQNDAIPGHKVCQSSIIDLEMQEFEKIYEFLNSVFSIAITFQLDTHIFLSLKTMTLRIENLFWK